VAGGLLEKRCLDALASIGVSPFTQKVYWDLKAAEEKAAGAAATASVSPELVTIQGMVSVMFGMNGGAAPAAASEATASQCDTFTGTALPAHQRRRKRAPALNSADLWDLPGGATGDCFRIVQSGEDGGEGREGGSFKGKESQTCRSGHREVRGGSGTWQPCHLAVIA